MPGKPNGYDQHAEKLAQLNRSGTNRSHVFIEKPSMFGLLPELKDTKVLSIGCGTGEECTGLSARGAKEVIGIDISRSSIQIAKKSFPELRFEKMDMHHMLFADNTFDFIYSSLCLHYSPDLISALGEIYRVLKPGCTAQFSVLHPLKWSGESRRDDNNPRRKAFLLGYDSFETPSIIYGDYLGIRPITQKPEGYPTIKFWTRPISSYFALIKESGLQIESFIEPSPVPSATKEDPDYYEVHSKIPQFMIFVVRKPRAISSTD